MRRELPDWCARARESAGVFRRDRQNARAGLSRSDACNWTEHTPERSRGASLAHRWSYWRTGNNRGDRLGSVTLRIQPISARNLVDDALGDGTVGTVWDSRSDDLSGPQASLSPTRRRLALLAACAHLPRRNRGNCFTDSWWQPWRRVAHHDLDALVRCDHFDGDLRSF